MEITYIYGNVQRLRLPTAVDPLHSQSTEVIGKFQKWKSFHKRKSCLIRLTKNSNLFISKNHYFTLFSRIKLFFSLLQTKLNLKWLTTLQQPWTNWLAPTMWTLVNAKTDFDGFLRAKILSTTWNVKLKVLKRDGNKQSRLAQNLTMRKADFNQFIRLRNQLVVAVRDFSREENLPRCKWNY